MLSSTAVSLGTNANHIFTYVTEGRPNEHLDVMMITEGPNGVAFSHYQRHPVTPGTMRVEVPPPPALRGTEPYLLVGAIRDVHMGDAPQDAHDFLSWIDASQAPFTFSGQIATREQFKAARRAAETWSNEFWIDPDRRRTVPTGIAAERFAELLLRELPHHRLTWEGTTILVEAALERGHVRAKRDASDMKPCEICTLAISSVLASVGLGAAIWFLLQRPASDIEDPAQHPRHIMALLDWMAARIRANYANASANDIAASVVGNLALGLNGVNLVWNGVSALSEGICRRFSDC